MKVSLRTVEEEDWKFILDIRNQKKVRQACHDTSIIEWKEHEKYMKKLDRDPNSHHWIVVFNNEDVGYAKIINEEFGYMIKDGFRGKGIGTNVYQLIFERAKKNGINKLHDTIKIDQPIPLKVALKVGFQMKDIIKKNNKPYAYSLEKHLDTILN